MFVLILANYCGRVTVRGSRSSWQLITGLKSHQICAGRGTQGWTCWFVYVGCSSTVVFTRILACCIWDASHSGAGIRSLAFIQFLLHPVLQSSGKGHTGILRCLGIIDSPIRGITPQGSYRCRRVGALCGSLSMTSTPHSSLVTLQLACLALIRSPLLRSALHMSHLQLLRPHVRPWLIHMTCAFVPYKWDQYRCVLLAVKRCRCVCPCGLVGAGCHHVLTTTMPWHLIPLVTDVLLVLCRKRPASTASDNSAKRSITGKELREQFAAQQGSQPANRGGGQWRGRGRARGWRGQNSGQRYWLVYPRHPHLHPACILVLNRGYECYSCRGRNMCSFICIACDRAEK